MEVYLAFGDRLLAYDCPSCDQRCCKTGSLPLFAQERQRLVQHSLALELVAPAELDTVSLHAAPCSGCWFLSAGRCRLEDAGAARTRPSACRLFPFNIFGLLNGTLVVAPHPLCPLEVKPGAGVAHAEVLRILEETGAAGGAPVLLRAPATAEIFTLERVLRQAAQASLGEQSPLPLVAFSELATQAFLQGGEAELARLDVGMLPQAIEAAHARLARYATIVGIASPDASSLATVAPLLAAWMPSLRLFALNGFPLALQPRAILALCLYTAHWQSLAPTRRLLPQTVAQILSALEPVVALLAASEEPWGGAAVPSFGVVPGLRTDECLLHRLPADPWQRQDTLGRLGMETLAWLHP